MSDDEQFPNKYVKFDPRYQVNPSSSLLSHEEMRGRLAEIERLIVQSSQGALTAVLVTWALLALILWKVW